EVNTVAGRRRRGLLVLTGRGSGRLRSGIVHAHLDRFPVGEDPDRHGSARSVLHRVRQGLLHYPFDGRSGDLGGNLPGDFDIDAHTRIPGSAHHRLEIEPDRSATVDWVFGAQDSEGLMQSFGRGDRAETDVRRSLPLLLTGPG